MSICPWFKILNISCNHFTICHIKSLERHWCNMYMYNTITCTCILAAGGFKNDGAISTFYVKKRGVFQNKNAKPRLIWRLWAHFGADIQQRALFGKYRGADFWYFGSLPELSILFRSTYWNDHKFSDRQVWANSVDPDQTAPWLFAIPPAAFGHIILW